VRRLILIAAGVGILACAGCATGQTGEPSAVGHNGATLTGQVTSNVGGTIDYWFQYGPTKAYGSESEHRTVTTPQNVPGAAAVAIGGLARSTVYHYRLCAQDSQQQGGPGCGEDRHFKTQSFACGETVTGDVRLTGNVSCFTSGIFTPGLVIGAAGLDINLNGFSLLGPVISGGGGGPGIENDGFDGVTVRDGRVGNFGSGVHVADATANRILHVFAQGAATGISVSGGQANEIRHSEGRGRNSGIVVAGSSGPVVADSEASGTFGSAIVFNNVESGRIVRNEAVIGGDSCCLSAGIVIRGNGNVIKDNRVGGWNGGNLVLSAGANNSLLTNELFDGVLPPQPESAQSQGDGIFVGAFTAGTLVRGNIAHDNAGDGIETQGSSGRLGDNAADDNGDFGIDAAAGVTDLGGNTATGNVNAVQCRNVFCP